MNENNKRAYRSLLYYAMILAKGNVGYCSSKLFISPADRDYIETTSAISYWLHNLAMYNYLDTWQDFDEEVFWKEYSYWESRFPEVFKSFKTEFEKELKSI